MCWCKSSRKQQQMCGFLNFMLHQILWYVRFHAASNFMIPTSIVRCWLVTRQENEATRFLPKYKGTAGKNGGSKPITCWGASGFYKYPCDPTWCHSTLIQIWSTGLATWLRYSLFRFIRTWRGSCAPGRYSSRPKCWSSQSSTIFRKSCTYKNFPWTPRSPEISDIKRPSWIPVGTLQVYWVLVFAH